MANVALVFAYGQKADGSLDSQSEARCKQAIKLYKEEKVGKLYFTCAVDKYGFRMAVQMARSCIRQDVSGDDCVVSEHGGNNTAGEIDTCLALLRRKDKVTAVSSWYHLPRIWFLFAVRGRLVKLSPSFGGVTLSDLLIEPLKIANAVLRPFRSSKICNPAPTL